MDKISKNDMVVGMKAIINPEMSPDGRYGDYLGEKVEIIRIRSSWSEPTVRVKVLSDGKEFGNVGSGSLVACDETKEDLQNYIIGNFEEKISKLEEKIERLKSEIEDNNNKITFIKETDAYTFDKKDYKKWMIKKIVSDKDIKEDEKEKMINDLISY